MDRRTDLVLLARWTHNAFETWSSHLPETWLEEHINTRSHVVEPAVLTKRMAEMCIQQLRKSAGSLLTELDPERCAGMKLELEECINSLSCHRDSLCPRFRNVRSLRIMSNTFITVCLRDAGQVRHHVTSASRHVSHRRVTTSRQRHVAHVTSRHRRVTVTSASRSRHRHVTVTSLQGRHVGVASLHELTP